MNTRKRGAANLIVAAVLGTVATVSVASANTAHVPAVVPVAVAPINAGPDVLPAAAKVGPVATGHATTNGAPAPRGMRCTNERNASQPSGLETICRPAPKPVAKPKTSHVVPAATGNVTSRLAGSETLGASTGPATDETAPVGQCTADCAGAALDAPAGSCVDHTVGTSYAPNGSYNQNLGKCQDGTWVPEGGPQVG